MYQKGTLSKLAESGEIAWRVPANWPIARDDPSQIVLKREHLEAIGATRQRA
jgi:hypothetical protein